MATGSAESGAGAVLLVDDDQMFRLTMQRLFRSRGWSAFGARHGREACELYAAIRPDVTFVDIVMQGGSGEMCVRQLIAVDPHAVIYAMSGLGPNDLRWAAMRAAGAMGKLPKPFTIDQALALLEGPK